MQIKFITLKELLPLRAKILRPGKKPDECIYPADENLNTFHLGIYDNFILAGVISVYKENFDNISGVGFRIRSMATDDAYRGKGLGSQLLKFAFEEFINRNGDYIWFNARKSAVNFYLKNGYEIISDEFEIENIGPHFVMIKRYNKSELFKSVVNLNIDDFNYILPPEKIAFFPTEKRDESKLLVFKNNSVIDDKFSNLTEHLPKNSLLIFNNTKVINGRIIFKTNDNKNIEILCLEPVSTKDFSVAMSQKSGVKWECMIGKLRNWNENFIINDFEKSGVKLNLKAKKCFVKNKFIVEFLWEPENFSFEEVLNIAGSTPLPPYIKRNSVQKDSETYQTVYASKQGSIAAPTAGLHFTDSILNEIDSKQIVKSFVTLHVNTGTFLPVKSEKIGNHNMHSEYAEVSLDTIKLLRNDFYIISVGTTVMRTVESLYWISYLILNKKFSDEFYIHQWLPYETEFNISKDFCLDILINYCEKNSLTSLKFKTSILLAPGYKYKFFKGLITNFHQPKSTLLLLISSFIGENYKLIYEHALKNDYRFLSYGDSNLYLL